MTEFYLIFGMAVITFLIRYPMFALANQVEFPPLLARALRYVPPAVLTAIIMPAVLMPHGTTLNLSYTNPYLIGALVAAGVSRLSRNLLLTIVLGMVAFFWRAIFVRAISG